MLTQRNALILGWLIIPNWADHWSLMQMTILIAQLIYVIYKLKVGQISSAMWCHEEENWNEETVYIDFAYPKNDCVNLNGIIMIINLPLKRVYRTNCFRVFTPFIFQQSSIESLQIWWTMTQKPIWLRCIVYWIYNCTVANTANESAYCLCGINSTVNKIFTTIGDTRSITGNPVECHLYSNVANTYGNGTYLKWSASIFILSKQN